MPLDACLGVAAQCQSPSTAFLQCLSADIQSLELIPGTPAVGVESVFNFDISEHRFLDSERNYFTWSPQLFAEGSAAAGSEQEHYATVMALVRTPVFNLYQETVTISTVNLLVNILLSLSAGFSAWNISRSVGRSVVLWRARRGAFCGSRSGRTAKHSSGVVYHESQSQELQELLLPQSSEVDAGLRPGRTGE